jgi:hypothetical protein
MPFRPYEQKPACSWPALIGIPELIHHGMTPRGR